MINIKSIEIYNVFVLKAIMCSDLTLLNHLMNDTMNRPNNIWDCNLYSIEGNSITIIYFLKKRKITMFFDRKSNYDIRTDMINACHKKILKLLIDAPITSDYIDIEVYKECQVCLIERNKDEEYKALEPCGHSGYCAECIKNIRKCPRCRCEINNREDLGEDEDEEGEEEWEEDEDE